MKFYILLLAVFLFLTTPVLYGQNKIDSLKSALTKDLTDDQEFSTLLQLRKRYLRSNPDSADYYLEEIGKLANKTGDQSIGFDYQYYTGEKYYLKGALDSAIMTFEKLIPETLAQRDSVRAYKTSNFMSIVLWRKGDLLQAVERGMDCLDYEKDESKHAILYNNLGGIFEEMDDDAKALEYYKKSLALHRESGNKMSISGTLGNIGVIYYNLDSYEEALAYLEESIELLRPFDNKMHLSIRLENIGNVYEKMGNYEEALVKFKEGIVLSEAIKDDYGISSIASNIGQSLIQLNKFNEASTYLKTAEEKARKINSLSLLIDALFYKAQLENKRGNYKTAFSLQSEYVELKDSLLNDQKIRAIQDMESKYQKAQQDNKLQKQEAIIKEGIAQRNMLILLVLSAIIIGALFLYFLQQRIAKNKKIYAQEKHIQAQKIKDLEKEKKILSLASMIEGQEAERTRIAKDLHDGLGGLLSTVKAHFSIIEQQVRQLEQINVYGKTTEMIDNAVEEVRRISHNLMPGALRLEGLSSAVEQIVGQLRSIHNLNVDYEVSNLDERFDENREVFVYRIIQEATNNIVKHADAKNVLIQISKYDKELNLVIEDDGKGFDQSDESTSLGIGLKSMQSRVEHLNGTFDIDAKKGTGTTITVNIPL